MNEVVDDMREGDSRTLTGTSDAAIQNRSELLKYHAALVASEFSQEALRGGKLDELKQRFIDDGVSLGYPRSQVLRYAQAFDDAAPTENGEES